MPPANSKVKSQCPLCCKEYKRLGRHLQFTHQLITASSVPSTLKEFLLVCKAFPFSNQEWGIVLQNSSQIADYIDKDTPLPAAVFATCYQVFDRYRASAHPKLILNKTIPKPK